MTYGAFSQNNTGPYPPFPLNISSLKILVQTVNSANNTVTASLIYNYQNGTQSTQALSGNTLDGSGNLFPWLIAGNLTAGDPLIKSSYFFFPFVFNETVVRDYAGSLRSVNLLNLTLTSPGQSSRIVFYWDAQTGLLLDATDYANYTGPSPSTQAITFKVTDTNVWTPTTGPDYSLDASSLSSGVLHAGELTSFRLDLASVNGFTGNVSLGASILGSNSTHPPSITLDPSRVTLSTLTPAASAVLAVSTNASTMMGQYIIAVNGISGSINHQAMLLVVVAPPDFIISANPGNLTILQGTSKNSTITVTGRGGFTGTVLLQAQTQPFGVIVTTSLNQTVLTLNATSTSATSTLTVGAINSQPGFTTIYINANSGNIYQNIYLPVNVTGPDFRITANPASLTLKQGQTDKSIITLTSIIGFAGTVNLSAFSYGTTSAQLANTSVNLSAGGQANTTLTITVPLDSPPGFSSVYVTGTTANGISHTVYLLLNVTGPDFAFTSSTYFLNLQAGQTAKSTLTLTSREGFSSTIFLSTSTSFSPVEATVSPFSVTLNSTQTSASATLIITVPLSTPPALFTQVEVIATSGNIVHTIYIEISITGPDFSVSANPSFISIPQSGSAQSTVSLSSIDNFSGNVTLSTSSVLATSFSSSTVNLAAGGSASTTLTIQAQPNTAPGNYYVGITASSGPLFRYTQVNVNVIGPDFSMIANPYFLTIRQGGSANSTITLTSIDNLEGTADVFVLSSGPITVSPDGAMVAILPNSTSTTTFKFSTDVNVPPGYYYIDIAASIGSITHDAFVSIQVTGPDFSIFSNPGSLILQKGTSGTSSVFLNSLDGFNGTVTVTLSSFDLNATPANSTVTLSPGGTASITITIQAPQATQPGSYYIQIVATSGALSHFTQVFVQVIGPDFSIQANPAQLFIHAGESGQSTILLTSLNGFSGNITLTSSYFYIIGGPNATFGSSPINVTLSPAAVTLTPGGTSSVILDVTSFPVATPQNFTIYISATGNNVTRFTSVFVSIIGPTFSLSSNPDFLIMHPGDSSTATITATSINGFTGNVSLAVASYFGISASLAPENVSLQPGSSSYSNLTITVPSGTPSGYYTIIVTGSAGTMARNVFVTVDVIAPTFTIRASPIFMSLAAGTTGTAIISLTGFNGFADTINLASSSFPAGLGTTIAPSEVTLNSTFTTTSAVLTITVPADSTSGFYDVNIVASTASHFENITVFVQVIGPDFGLTASPSNLLIPPGGSATSTITISGLNGFNGTVSLFGYASAGPGVTASFSPENVTLTPSEPNATSTLTISVAPGTYPGPYIITIIGSLATNSNATSLVHFATVVVTVPETPNFQMLVSTGLLFVVQGSSNQAVLTLTSLSGFSGNVTVTAEIIPQGPTVAPSQTVITLTMNSTVETSLTVSAGDNTPPGIYTLVLNATSAGISHPNSIEIMVTARPDFSLSTTPAALIVQAGESASVTVNLSGLNGFVAVVQLFATVSPSGVSAVPDPSTIQVLSDNLTQAGLIISTTTATSPGNYTIYLTGNSTSGSHTTSITLTVVPRPDFILSSSASALIIQTGASATSSISVSPTGGFTGPVTLSTIVQSGFTTSFSINPITGGAGTSTLTITVGSSVAAGSYTLTVNGNSGSTTHSTTINVTVTTSTKTTLVVNQVSWAHRLSLTKNGSTQTFTVTVKNNGKSPAYVQLLAAGNSTNLKSFFNVESAVSILSPGASLTISLSQPFNTTSIGLKFNFTIQLFSGTGTDPSGNILSPQTTQVVKGTFTIVS